MSTKQASKLITSTSMYYCKLFAKTLWLFQYTWCNTNWPLQSLKYIYYNLTFWVWTHSFFSAGHSYKWWKNKNVWDLHIMACLSKFHFFCVLKKRAGSLMTRRLILCYICILVIAKTSIVPDVQHSIDYNYLFISFRMVISLSGNPYSV